MTACRDMPTRTCPVGSTCEGRPCARFEDPDESRWAADLRARPPAAREGSWCPAATGAADGRACPAHPDGAHRCAGGPSHAVDDGHQCICGVVWSPVYTVASYRQMGVRS